MSEQSAQDSQGGTGGPHEGPEQADPEQADRLTPEDATELRSSLWAARRASLEHEIVVSRMCERYGCDPSELQPATGRIKRGDV